MCYCAITECEAFTISLITAFESGLSGQLMITNPAKMRSFSKSARVNSLKSCDDNGPGSFRYPNASTLAPRRESDKYVES